MSFVLPRSACVYVRTYNAPTQNRRWIAILVKTELFISCVQSIDREKKVKAKNGKVYYLVEVIAHILKYLKELLIRKLNASGMKLEATDFDWVITVPAIWRARGKQMMREAGYKVC